MADRKQVGKTHASGGVERCGHDFISLTEYFRFLHERVNHIQGMQTSVTSVISSLAVSVPAVLLALTRARNLSEVITTAFVPVYVLVVATLLWAQWVSMYQLRSVFKLVNMLMTVETYRPHLPDVPLYFDHKPLRKMLYAASHALPTLYLLGLPAIVARYGVDFLDAKVRIGLTAGTVLITVLMLILGWRSLYSAFSLRDWMSKRASRCP